MKERAHWMQRLTEEWMKTEVLPPGLPLVEICGERRVLIEHHRGVSRYSRELICVRVSYGEIAVRGSGLELARMTKEQIVICGCVECISLVKGGSR